MSKITRFFKWYFTKNALPFWGILIMDCAIVFISCIIGFYPGHRAMQTLTHYPTLLPTAGILALLSIVGFRLFHTYSGIFRYSSFVDLMKVAYANALSTLLCIAFFALFPNVKELEYFSPVRTIGVFVIATAIMWFIRIIVKQISDVASSDKSSQGVFIYGAMEDGVGLSKNIRSQRPMRFILKGFISHDGQNRNARIMGEKVYSAKDDLESVIQKDHVQAVLVSPLRVDDFRNDQQLQDRLIKAGLKIYMASQAKEWTGEDNIPQEIELKEVNAEELLPREKIEVNMEAIGNLLKGKCILITGAAGSIGSEMVRQVAQFKPSHLILIDQAETPMHDIRLMMWKDFPDLRAETIVTSICKEDRMEDIFAKYKPEYVFHAAAYKHVPMMEDNPKEAVQNNIYGTRVIADLAVKYGTKKFVMISTDKAVNPTNVMGCSKRICEIYCQALNSQQQITQFVTTRFGNVLGSNGSVIPLFKKQIKEGGPVTVTHPDIIRYFMLIPEACRLVLEAGTMGKGGEIFVFDMGKPVKIADLAKRMIMLSGAKDIDIIYTGLRDGEKLYEEVLSDKETTKPTVHPKIMVAAVQQYAYEDILAAEEALYNLTFTADDMTIVKKMKEIVPEFKSQHSKYEALD